MKMSYIQMIYKVIIYIIMKIDFGGYNGNV